MITQPDFQQKADASDLLRRSGVSPGPTLNACLAIAAREKEGANSPIPSPSWILPPNDRAPAPPDSQTLDESLTTQEGDYCAEPSISTLSKLGYEELAKVAGLVVKRVGFGEIRFLEPVDPTSFTTLTKLSDLLSEQVRFDTMECGVHPTATALTSHLLVTGSTSVHGSRCWTAGCLTI